MFHLFMDPVKDNAAAVSSSFYISEMAEHPWETLCPSFDSLLFCDVHGVHRG